MGKEYITIKEYAGAVGKSVQSIYSVLKKQDNYLKDYVYTINGKKVLKADILKNNGIDNIVIENYNSSTGKGDKDNINLYDNEFIINLKEQIDFLKKQIDTKDKTIIVLQNTINSLENTVNEQVKVINNSQQLLLVEKTTNGNVILQDDKQKEAVESKNNKKTLFSWLFDRK